MKHLIFASAKNQTILMIILMIGLLPSSSAHAVNIANIEGIEAFPILIPGTVELSEELTAAVKAVVESGYSGLPEFDYYAIVSDQTIDTWHLMSIVGLVNLTDPDNWNIIDNGVWFSTILVYKDGKRWIGVLNEDERFNEMMSKVPNAILSADLKNALISSNNEIGTNSIDSVVYPHLPFQPGTLIQYGTSGVHSNNGSKECVDLFTDGNTGAGHAPNQLLASQAGAIDWVCTPRSGEKTSAVRMGNLWYFHMSYNPSLQYYRSVDELGLLGSLYFGSFGSKAYPEACGYAVQNASHGHVHFCFPVQETVTFGGWTLNTVDEKWRRGSTTISPLQWFSEELAPPPCPANTSTQVHVCSPSLTPTYSNNSCSTYWYPISGFNGIPAYLTENATYSSTSSNTGRWTPNLPETGRYKVEAFIAGHNTFNIGCSWGTASLVPDTTHAQYSVTHNSGTTQVIRDQSAFTNQWMALGEFDFNSGTTGFVTLSDVTGETRLSRNPNFGALRFTRVYPAVNPIPNVTSVWPSNLIVGGYTFTLTINGLNFLNSSVVQFNGQSRATTYINNGELNATITAQDISVADINTITVFNPAPGGGVSNAVDLNVVNPLPILDSISPTSVIAGTGDFELILIGSNFTIESVARWNDQDCPTTFIKNDELRALISSDKLESSGTASVQVINPSPGGGLSKVLSIEIKSDIENVYLPFIVR